VGTNSIQAWYEWREQKPTYDVPREGVITTACDSVPLIFCGMARVRVHHNIRLESVIAAEEGYEAPSGKVGSGIKFDSIAVGKSGRDQVIIEWFLVG